MLTIRLAKKSVCSMNTLFNTVTGENKKCVIYFYLKLTETFGHSNIRLALILDLTF